MKNTKARNRIPILYYKKENCCGCFACYSTCKVKAIRMKPDDEGFLYPEIVSELCIGCRQCVEVCAFKKYQKENGYLN